VHEPLDVACSSNVGSLRSSTLYSHACFRILFDFILLLYRPHVLQSFLSFLPVCVSYAEILKMNLSRCLYVVSDQALKYERSKKSRLFCLESFASSPPPLPPVLNHGLTATYDSCFCQDVSYVFTLLLCRY
jgi:hypothetical protein